MFTQCSHLVYICQRTYTSNFKLLFWGYFQWWMPSTDRITSRIRSNNNHIPLASIQNQTNHKNLRFTKSKHKLQWTKWLYDTLRHRFSATKKFDMGEKMDVKFFIINSFDDFKLFSTFEESIFHSSTKSSKYLVAQSTQWLPWIGSN